MNALQRAWQSFRDALSVKFSRDVAMMNVGGQVMVELDRFNQEEPNDMLHHWLQDIYFDDSKNMYAISISGGKLFRWAVTIDGEENVILGDPSPVKPFFGRTQAGSVSVRAREGGGYEGFAIMGSAALNKNGQIDSRSLFDSFQERFRGINEYVNIYHLGGEVTRIGRVTALFREENLLVGYLTFDDNLVALRAAETMAADKQGKWGGSIEFMSDDEGSIEEVAPDVNITVFTRGTFLGYSIARSVDGAAWGTNNFIQETKQTMNEKNRGLVAELLGGDEKAVAMVEKWLDGANMRLSDAITRMAEQATDEPVEQAAEEVVTPVAQTAATPVAQAVAEPVEQAAEEPVEAAAGDMPADAPPADAPAASDQLVASDELVNEIVQRIQESEWADSLQQDYAALAARLDAAESSIDNIYSQLSDAAASAAGQTVDLEATALEAVAEIDLSGLADLETVEQLTAQLTTLTEEVAQLRAFYDANRPAAQTARVLTYRPAAGRVERTATPAPSKKAPVARDGAPVVNAAAKPAVPATASRQWKPSGLF